MASVSPTCALPARCKTPHCDEPQAPERRYCVACLEARRDADAARRRAEHADGICKECHARPVALSSKWRCEECLERDRERARERVRLAHEREALAAQVEALSLEVQALRYERSVLGKAVAELRAASDSVLALVAHIQRQQGS